MFNWRILSSRCVSITVHENEQGTSSHDRTRSISNEPFFLPNDLLYGSLHIIYWSNSLNLHCFCILNYIFDAWLQHNTLLIQHRHQLVKLIWLIAFRVNYTSFRHRAALVPTWSCVSGQLMNLRSIWNVLQIFWSIPRLEGNSWLLSC